MRLSCYIFSLLVILCPDLKASDNPHQNDTAKIPALSVTQQRTIYQRAKQAFSDRHLSQYRQLKQQLSNYPLLPYLDFMEIAAKLKERPYTQVGDFLAQQSGSYLGERLRRRWLKQLAAQKRWQDFRDYYKPAIDSAGFQCLYLWSRLQTQDNTALQDVAALWDVGYSQPDDCDNLFAYWRQQGYLTPDLQWRRFTKVMQHHNLGLARYLLGFMSTDLRHFAEQLLRLHNKPDSIRQLDQFQNAQPLMADIVYHGLRRLARKAPEDAHALLAIYQRLYSFTPEQVNAIHYRLANEFAKQQQADLLKPLLAKLTTTQQAQLVEKMLRQWLKEQHWEKIDEWIAHLPSQVQQDHRWQYWQTRAREALASADQQSINASYYALASKRNYYGFLAADRLQQTYNFEHKALRVEDDIRRDIARLPSIQRARELFFIGDLHQARQEWKYSMASFDDEAIKAAASLAFDWGWYRKSIEAMTAAQAWDDLDIRFPISYRDAIFQQAAQHKLPPTLILSIARQESAWQSDARSRAGAMGLMQLMPQTAKETARKARIKHHRHNLYQPQHNIALGSYHLKELITHYKHNRLPAIAAYNAGRSKVNRWLAETGQQLPFDIWIEVIPYKETRHYVKNILSYSLVYAYRLGKNPRLITQEEADSLL
ncbi:MAG: transglycosylase SLT domain-containing protein [Cellvibrionaceae bacterium]|nr:transglycosylase SLT domain-containing protein [Cellvibrionaceae bacterium]